MAFYFFRESQQRGATERVAVWGAAGEEGELAQIADST